MTAKEIELHVRHAMKYRPTAVVNWLKANLTAQQIQTLADTISARTNASELKALQNFKRDNPGVLTDEINARIAELTP